jgi:hypothetical protein
LDRRRFLSSMLASSAAAAMVGTRHRASAAIQTAPSARPRFGGAHRASVTDFGADPTGLADATLAVRRAVAALAQNSARLVFPPGRYRFAPAPDPIMSFFGYDGLEVFGNGAELFFSADPAAPLPAQLLRIENCSNVEIHDLKLDWARPPFSQAVVTAVDDHTLTLAIDPQFPVSGVPPVITGTLPVITGTPPVITGTLPVSALAEYDPQGAFPAANGLVLQGVVTAVQAAGPQQLRLALDPNLAPPSAFRKGMRLVLLHSAHAAPTLHLCACDMVLLESVALYAAPGDGVLLEGCHDVSLDDFRVIPRPAAGHLLSLNGVAARLVDCQGAITIKRSQFTGMGGGGLALHQSYWRIAALLGDKSTLVTGPGGHPLAPWQMPDPNSILQISNSTDLELLGEIGLASAENTPAGTRLTFRETLSAAIRPGALLCNALAQPRTSLDHCLFASHLGESIAAQGRIRVTNTRFADTAAPALLFAPRPAALEGPAVASVTIADSTFSHCNRARPQPPAIRRGTITVGQIAGPRQTAEISARVNQGVTIQHNAFTGDGGPAIDCAGLSWLTVENNTFGPANILAGPGAPAQAIVLRRVDQSFIDANQSQIPQQIALIACTEKVQATGNGRLTEVRQA